MHMEFPARRKTPETRIAEVRNEIQARAAMEHYRRTHAGAQDDEVRKHAMKEWIRDPNNPNTLAARFSDYIDDHPDEIVNIADPAAVSAFVERVENYQRPETLH